MRNPLRALFGETRSIGSSHELWEHLSRGVRSIAGVDVSETTAMQVATVLTCVNGIASDISSLPLDLIERVNERERRPAVGNPLRRVLSQPNSWQTSAEWLGMQIAHILLRGNAYNLIVRSNLTSNGSEQITELLPLHPDQVSVEQRPYPDLRIDYKWTSISTGKTYEFVNDGAKPQILHFRGLSTNGIMGRSVLSDARDVLGVAIATQNHAATFWKAGGLPTVVLKHPKTLSDKAKTSLEKAWSRAYGGGADQSRVAVIEEGMEMQPISVALDDLQFLETRKYTRGELFGLFRYPPHMAGDTEKSTSWGTGIEQQQIGYLMFGLLPIVRRMEQRMDRDLVRNSDRFNTKFFLHGFMRGDMTSRKEFYTAMLDRGVFSIDDVRMLEDMNPVEGGSLRLVQKNMVPLNKIEAIVDAETSAKAPQGQSNDEA